MSTRKISALPQVIVRSFGDEPVVLCVHGIDGQKKRAFVGSANAAKPISLPFEDVFDYSKEVFTRLREAFTQNNAAQLRELYNSLRGKRSCNRYQDALIYAHEEKPEIADSRSVA